MNGDTVSGTGRVKFNDLEGGFWAIRGDDDRRYNPMNLPEEFQREDLAISFTGRIRSDMVSIHMAGEIIELTSIQRR